MKPRSIQSLLLAAAVFTPPLRAQDAPAKIHEIEQKVLQEQYQKAVRALVASAREPEGHGDSPPAPDLIGKRVQWVAMVGGQIEGDGRVADANQEEMVKNAATLNELAWNLITAQEAAARRPEIALQLAEIAMELGGGDRELKPKVLDTRARALFLLGKREEAIAGQESAVAATTLAAEKAELETTLAAYRRGELPVPAREPEAVLTPEAALAAKDLKSRTDEILALQNRLEKAGKENSGIDRNERDRVKGELKKRMDELARLTEVKDPAAQRGHSVGATYILGKLRTIVIPSISFENTTLEEAVDFLRKRSLELDTTEPDPARKGVNFVVRLPAENLGSAPDKGKGEREAIRIKGLQLRNVPLAEALRYLCDATRFRYKVDDFAVTLVSPDAPEDLFSRTFSVPPDLGSSLVSIQDLLKMCGVKFGEGASATLISPNMLVVRNTPTELDKIELLIEAVIHARADREPSNQPVPAESAPAAGNPRER